jgi:D-3-phosphoglycerate dehydrogenase / 2-oxoglutarate reductase
MKPKILVTPRSLTIEPHPAIARLFDQGFEISYPEPGKLPEERELLELVPGCVGWLAGVERVSPSVIAAASQLRVISRNGVGVDNLPMDSLRSRGITVVVAEGANASGVAELAVTLMFAALRQIGFTDAGIKAGGWPRRRGREIRGRTVAVIGFGAIGRTVTSMVTALGANVIAYDPFPKGSGFAHENFRMGTLGECLENADIITLHCPASAEGPILNDRTLDKLRDGAIVVNTARAALVDDAAMLRSLASQKVSTYATDVFPNEPPDDLTLAKHDRVLATSHIGGFTDESVERATQTAVANLIAVLSSRT